MSEVEPFLKLLDSTVKASRLSGTKTKQLSQDSLKIAASYDTKIVSSFLKLNNSLKPASQQRISSLYVFDAIARANKGQKGRDGFMEKMEGVVDSWVRGMLTDGQGGPWTEGREKMRKVLDIWTKGTTFPRECLDELERQLSAAAAASEPAPESTTPPFSPALPPLELKNEASNGGVINGQDTETARTSSITSPPAAVGQLPPEIQRLLGIQASQQQQNGSASPAPGGVDLASILATLKPSANTHTPPLQGSASTPTPTAASALANAPTLAGAGLPKIDPAQLAALANLTSLAKPPAGGPAGSPYTQQQGTVPPPALAGMLGGAHPSPPISTYGGAASPAAGQAYGHTSSQPSQSPHLTGAPGAFPPFPPSSGGPSQYPPARALPSAGYNARPSPPHRGSADAQWRDHGRQTSFDGGREGFGGRQRSRSPPTRRPGGEWGAERGYGPARDDSGPDWSRGERDEWAANRAGDGRGRGRGGSGARGRGGYADRASRGLSQDHERDDGYAARGGPPRPEFEQQPSREDNGALAGQSSGRAPVLLQPGKDEFGRDLPPGAASTSNSNSSSSAIAQSSAPAHAPHTRASAQISPHAARASLPPLPPSVPQPPTFSGPSTNMPPRPPAPSTASATPPFRAQQAARAKPTLDTFDTKTFDPNVPASWAALAEAWEGSNGRQPNQMELMEWLMMAQMRGAMGGGGAGQMGQMGQTGQMGQMGGFGGGGAMGTGGMNGGMGAMGAMGAMGGMNGTGRLGGMGGPHGQGQGGYSGRY